METDGYYNDLTFDQAVNATVNVLLVLGRLYKQHQPREGEPAGNYSQLSGLHSMGWQDAAWKDYVKSFNRVVDQVNAANQSIKTRAGATRLSKDKTRLLQFCPTVDLLEKVISLLAGRPELESFESPEDLVRKLASVDIDNVLATLQPQCIDSLISSNAVLSSEVLAKWFSSQYTMHENMPAVIRKFLDSRKGFVLKTPRPGAIFALAQDGRLELPGDLLETFKGIVKTPLLWSDYVRDPGNTEAALVQMQFELLLLALCGLVKFHDGRVLPQTYPLACQEKPSALLVLETLDPEMDLSSVEPLLPQGPRHSMLNLTHALAVAALLRKFMDGSEEATLEAQSCCDALFFCPSLSTSCVHVWSFLKRLLTNCPIPLLCPLLQARREAFEWSQTNSKPF